MAEMSESESITCLYFGPAITMLSIASALKTALFNPLLALIVSKAQTTIKRIIAKPSMVYFLFCILKMTTCVGFNFSNKYKGIGDSKRCSLSFGRAWQYPA